MKVGDFSADETLISSDDNSIYTLLNDRINVRSFQVRTGLLGLLGAGVNLGSVSNWEALQLNNR